MGSRRRSPVEDREYVAFCARIIRSAGKRAGAADPETLAEFLELKTLIDQVAADAMIAMQGLESDGAYSWPQIAAPLRKDPRAVQRWAARHTTIRDGHDDRAETAEIRSVA